MEITTIGIDLAKNVFSRSRHGRDGLTVVQGQFRHRQLLLVAQLRACPAPMEACGFSALSDAEHLVSS